jgi:hypothetical protein
MSLHITVENAQAWLETTKLPLGDIDDELEDSVATQILSRVAQAYDTSGWLDSTTTPKLVRKLIAMQYVVWVYRRQYSEDGGTNEYADMLQAAIDSLLTGITGYIVPLVDVPPTTGDGTGPVFYPTDLSSALTPDSPTGTEVNGNDQSLGPAAFRMGQVF